MTIFCIVSRWSDLAVKFIDIHEVRMNLYFIFTYITKL
jgi:hypothetical protein